MPNWCSTNITISGSFQDIADLNHYLEKWCEKPYKENGFDTVEMKEGPKYGWLGNLAGNCGLYKSEADWPECRGQIVYYNMSTNFDLGEGFITIDTETAWVPMVSIWQDINDKLFDGRLEIVYTAEELGFDIFCTNDPAYKDECLVREDGDIWEYVLYSDLKKYMIGLYDDVELSDEMTVDEMIEAIQEKHESFYVRKIDWIG